MDNNQSKSFEQLLRNQRKEEIKIKSKKMFNPKNKKVNSFKSSLEKLFRLKSKSEKSLKHEDLLVGMIPQTIYLSPQQTLSLSRDTWYLNQTQSNPISKESVRHSCSDFVCRRSSTFCMIDVKKLEHYNQQRSLNRSVSPQARVFSPVKEEESSVKITTVPHSVSMPAHLSKSHQNITKCNQGDLEIIRPAKRTVRKKGLFNCSLFRKRSNSNSKSREKIGDVKSQSMRSRDKTKSLNRSNNKNLSTLSDRCLTLPNLKSSDVDLTQNTNINQLLSMDLIKDYLNRSENSLHSSAQRKSVDCNVINSSQQSSVSVQNSSHSSANYKCDIMTYKTSKIGFCDSMILESPTLSESFYAQPSTSSDQNHSWCSRATSPLTINSAFENTNYIYSNGPPTLNENTKPPCIRQISAPIYYQAPQSTHQYLSPTSTNSAFEFWTRPYQEKIKASRRRLLDDKVGSKEALLRSLSPHNLKLNEPNAIYDNPYHLQMIPEPMTLTTHEHQNSDISSPTTITTPNTIYNAAQYRLTNHDHMFRDPGSRRSASPVIENRLSESPMSIPKRKDIVYQTHNSNYLIYNTDLKNEPNQPTVTAEEILQSKKDTNRTNFDKIPPFQRIGSISDIKDNKSINSSSDLVLTRTPSPPHSFAESSVSSIYPAPNEFITEPQTNTTRLCGTVNLLYTSDNSEDENDEFAHTEIEPVPPIPPPRTDSVLRSLQAQLNADADKSELEYDISDEFPPVFSGANIDRCDIEQYHKWLEKLPYKLSEFSNLLQCRKSSVSACKISPLTENVNCIGKKVDLVALKQFKQCRKSIKSWNTSENSKPSDSGSVESEESLSYDGYSMKKSFSYDQSLNNSEVTCIAENSPSEESTQQGPIVDATLLKQYSHLYSLKPSPSQTPNIVELTSSALQFHRSKSIDFRNFVNNVSGTSIAMLEKFSQKRKSVPNSNFSIETTKKEISGKIVADAITTKNPEYKVYPML